MKSLPVIAGSVIGAALAALAPVAATVYADLYPVNPERSQALRQCAAADPNFKRLLAATRAACYERHIHAQPANPSPTPPAGHGSARGIAVG